MSKSDASEESLDPIEKDLLPTTEKKGEIKGCFRRDNLVVMKLHFFYHTKEPTHHQCHPIIIILLLKFHQQELLIHFFSNQQPISQSFLRKILPKKSTMTFLKTLKLERSSSTIHRKSGRACGKRYLTHEE
jgi:hypothetical protein